MTTATLEPPVARSAGSPARILSKLAGFLSLALVLALYISFLATRFAPAISDPDDNGYFAQGSLLAQTGKTWFTAESDAQYIGMHWLLTPAGNFISRYPPGLPAVIAAVYHFGGWRAAAMANPALSVIALIGFFFLARRIVSGGWAIVGVAALAANPTFIRHALSGDSHMAVTALLAWGLFMLIRWSSTGRLFDAALAGLILGCIPTVRYPDAIMLIAVGIFFLWHWRRFPQIWKHYLAAAAGAAVPILPLLIRNQILLGAFWRTGYSLTNEETGFSLAYFQQHAIEYVHQISGNALGLLFALGFVGMVCMIFKRSAERRSPVRSAGGSDAAADVRSDAAVVHGLLLGSAGGFGHDAAIPAADVSSLHAGRPLAGARGVEPNGACRPDCDGGGVNQFSTSLGHDRRCFRKPTSFTTNINRWPNVTDALEKTAQRRRRGAGRREYSAASGFRAGMESRR